MKAENKAGLDERRVATALEVTHVCTVCLRRGARGPGTCRRCGVPLFPLADPVIREEAREKADLRLQRRLSGERSAIILVFLVVAAVVELATDPPYGSPGWNPFSLTG